MKRNKGKFTIQFNLDNEYQVRAAEYLNQLGRIKAHVIAVLICAALDNKLGGLSVPASEQSAHPAEVSDGNNTQQNSESDIVLNNALSDNLSLWE